MINQHSILAVYMLWFNFILGSIFIFLILVMHPKANVTYARDGGGGGHSLIWPKGGRAKGQVMVFGFSTLNKV